VADHPFLIQQTPADGRCVAELGQSLGAGEAAAIALALEVGAEAILIDERRARKTAERFGLKPIGVLAVLANAKALGLIHAVAPLVEDLRSRVSFRVHPDVLARVLRSTGEA
jgi:predicted nucleic acid-binding protein